MLQAFSKPFGAVILNEVQDLNLLKNEILRPAQNDKMRLQKFLKWGGGPDARSGDDYHKCAI